MTSFKVGDRVKVIPGLAKFAVCDGRYAGQKGTVVGRDSSDLPVLVELDNLAKEEELGFAEDELILVNLSEPDTSIDSGVTPSLFSDDE